MTSLESRDYVATPTDIEALTRILMTASMQTVQSQTTYLKTLVATTQAEYGMQPRLRAGKTTSELTADDTKAQLAALEAVHLRFYDAVLSAIKAAPADIATPARQRKKFMHAKATFARTAKSTLRAWLRSGHDLRALAAARVTKYALAKEIPRRAASAVTTLQRRTLGLADRILSAAGEAAKTDKTAALNALETVMSLLAKHTTDMGGSLTTRPDVAAREGRPFKRGDVVFWPTTAAEAARTGTH